MRLGNPAVLSLLMLSFATPSQAAPPYFNGGWQWNDSVKIDFMYASWEDGPTHLHLDNGQFCFIEVDEKSLLAVALAARASGATVQAICTETPEHYIDGLPARHLHRFKY